jgi:hypothetical protein
MLERERERERQYKDLTFETSKGFECGCLYPPFMMSFLSLRTPSLERGRISVHGSNSAAVRYCTGLSLSWYSFMKMLNWFLGGMFDGASDEEEEEEEAADDADEGNNPDGVPLILAGCFCFFFAVVCCGDPGVVSCFLFMMPHVPSIANERRRAT